MRSTGFSSSDYDVMANSCNSFTESLSSRLGLLHRYPTGVLQQTKLADLLSPVARALDLVPRDRNGGRRSRSSCLGSLVPGGKAAAAVTTVMQSRALPIFGEGKRRSI